MNLKKLSAVQLRTVLSVALLILVALGAGVFAYGYKQLGDHAIAAQGIATQAQVSQTSLQTLVAQQEELAKYSSVVSRAHQLVANSKEYEYQDQIISDINTYAVRAGIEVSSFTFEDNNAKTSKGATAATPKVTPTPAGVKSTSVSVSIRNPTSYDAVLRFVNLLQQSLFRMQISGVGLAMTEESTVAKVADPVNTEQFTIEVYIR